MLRPGEEVRTPLIALVFWQGEKLVRAQNLWRRWMLADNVPRNAEGKLPAPILFGNTSGEFNEMTSANEENQKYFINRYLEERVPIDLLVDGRRLVSLRGPVAQDRHVGA